MSVTGPLYIAVILATLLGKFTVHQRAER